MVDFGMYPCVLALNPFFDVLPPCHFQSDHLDLWSHNACCLLWNPFFFPIAMPHCSDTCCCCLCHWYHGVYMCWIVCSWGMKFWMGANVYMSSFSVHGNVRKNFHVVNFCWWDSSSAFESGTKFFKKFLHKFQIWVPMTYCILCTLHICRAPIHVRPKLCAVQQICPSNLPWLPHPIIPPVL